MDITEGEYNELSKTLNTIEYKLHSCSKYESVDYVLEVCLVSIHVMIANERIRIHNDNASFTW